MTTVNKSIVINATREDIRPMLHDPDSVLARDANVYHYEPDENWPVAGSKLELGFKTIAFNVDSIATSLEYDPKTLNLAYRNESENFEPAMWHWTFDENDGRTTVTLQVDYSIPGSYLGKAIDKLLLERQNAKQVEQTLAALKTQVETSI